MPEDGNDIPMAGINYKRKITRQRFTAAHELCHHLKDCRKWRGCPLGIDADEYFRDLVYVPPTWNHPLYVRQDSFM